MGTRFDGGQCELRRITGVRNIRQALASPYPVSIHDPARLSSERIQQWHVRKIDTGGGKGSHMTRFSRFALAAVLVASTSACAVALRNPHVADLQNNPGRYQNRSVHIDGVVTTSWGFPLSPLKFYKVDDGTGEVTVLSQGARTPTRGSHVKVKGRVDELAVFGGRAVGLHLKEERLSVRR